MLQLSAASDELAKNSVTGNSKDPSKNPEPTTGDISADGQQGNTAK
jgi:hypothetical protein